MIGIFNDAFNDLHFLMHSNGKKKYLSSFECLIFTYFKGFGIAISTVTYIIYI